jgi:hypothetical protein
MKGILINPANCSITFIEHNGDFRQIQEIIEAHTFDCVRIDQSETFYVDDEGLFNQRFGFFRVEGDNPVVLAGKALILATDEEGDSISTTLTLEKVKEMIDFVTPIRVDGTVILAGDKAIYSASEPFARIV